MEENGFKGKEVYFLLLNSCVPILSGAVIYYFFFPEVMLVKLVDSFLGLGIHVEIIKRENVLWVFLRNYMLDMMWAYALTFSLYMCVGNKTANVWKIFIGTFLFSSILEVLQISSVIHGTFDLWDCVLEGVSEAIAVFIIKSYFTRRN